MRSLEPQRPPSVSSQPTSREPTMDRGGTRQHSLDRGMRPASLERRIPTRPLPPGRILNNGSPASNSAPSSLRFPQGPSPQTFLLGRCLQQPVEPHSGHMMPTMELPMHRLDQHRRSFAEMPMAEPAQPLPSPDQQGRSQGAFYLDADPRSNSSVPSTPHHQSGGRRGMSPSPGRSLSSATPSTNITLPMVMLDD